MEEDSLRQRARRKLIRVILPDGEMICYANVTETFIAVLQRIGSDRFPEIKLEIGHLPMLSQVAYPKYGNYMKPVCDGWYLNTQSNTDQKYIQLRAINDSLNLGWIVEIGENFIKQKNPDKVKRTRSLDSLKVVFPDGECISNPNSIDTFVACLTKFGVEEIIRRGLEWGGNPLITRSRFTNRQVQVAEGRWVTVPTTTKERAKLIRVLGALLRQNLEIIVG